MLLDSSVIFKFPPTNGIYLLSLREKENLSSTSIQFNTSASSDSA